MATDIPMNTLLQVLYDNNDLNGLSVDGCEWRKPYTVTIPAKPTGVASITVTRSDSESNCGQLSTTSITSTGKVLYGDTVSVSATASSGYDVDATTVSFKSGVTNNKVTGDVTLNVKTATGKTYYVYYKQGLASSTTNLPSTQSRTYPNAVTLATNSMSKTSATANSYTVSYSRGDANSSATLPSTQTSKNTTTYTANGWTTGSSNTNDQDYANKASFGSSSTTNLTLYPNFTTSTTNGGVTLSSTKLPRSSTSSTSTSSDSGKTITVDYNMGLATSGTLPSDQTATGGITTTTTTTTTSYTQNGWSGSNGKTYSMGAATGALTANLTMTPTWSSSTSSSPSSSTTAAPSITLGTNSMSKSSTTSAGYAVTLNYNGSGASNSTLYATNTTSYSPNGWTTSYNSTNDKDYSNGATTTSSLTLYPNFTTSVSRGSVSLPTPSRTNYDFEGWATSSSASSGITGSYTPTGNVTLYAIWSYNPPAECICGETGYHYCVCCGEYHYADDGCNGSSSGGGGGGGSTMGYCECCGNYTEVGSYGVCYDCNPYQ